MDAQNRDAAKAAAKDRVAEGPSDKRSRRIRSGKLYAAGVSEYRTRHLTESPATTDQAAATSIAQVLVRARPLFAHEADRGEWESLSVVDGKGIVLHEGLEAMRNGGMVNMLRHHSFGDNVSTVSTDAELYDSVRYLVKHAVDGGLSTLFCYGMTGSGKTYSMGGIHTRVPADIFSLISSSQQEEVKFSSYELLAKRCFELLPKDYEASAGEETVNEKNEIFLRVDAEGVTNVCGVAEHSASDADSLVQLLHAAVSRRETSATSANATSSRSHAVYLVKLPGGGRLHLIDLAGNEGSQETLFHNKAHTAEAKEISNSLAVLRTCLRSRTTPGSHVPFRESVLTRVLKDTLTDPQAATALLACVSPCCTHIEHSLRTLKTAVYLTASGSSAAGDESTLGVHVEEEELKMAAVVKKGPATWDHAALCSWITEQNFDAEVKLPAMMTGKAIMKLTKPRLKPLCDGKENVAAELFAALRVAAKEADKYAREQRAQVKEAGNSAGGAAGFARGAPERPQVALTGAQTEETKGLAEKEAAAKAEAEAEVALKAFGDVRSMLAFGDAVKNA